MLGDFKVEDVVECAQYNNAGIMSLEEAQKAVNRRNRWCRLLLKISWKARVLDYLAGNDYLYRFGKDVHILYEERHPESHIQWAMARLMVEPMIRHIGWAELGKQIVSVTPMEEKNE